MSSRKTWNRNAIPKFLLNLSEITHCSIVQIAVKIYGKLHKICKKLGKKIFIWICLKASLDLFAFIEIFFRFFSCISTLDIKDISQSSQNACKTNIYFIEEKNICSQLTEGRIFTLEFPIQFCVFFIGKS